jgi:hypothetical protein
MCALGHSAASCLKGVSPFDFVDVPVIDGVNHPSDKGHGYEIVGHLRFIPTQARAGRLATGRRLNHCTVLWMRYLSLGECNVMARHASGSKTNILGLSRRRRITYGNGEDGYQRACWSR